MLEFKRDDVQNHDLARELVALLNLAGGAVLLGVDESGAIVGSTRHARNQTLVNVMRDYAYMEALGMGMRNTITPGLRAHNGTTPELIAEEHRFIVRLLKRPRVEDINASDR